MEDTYWLKQTDGPLFEDVLWSRPENKQRAGKLLIVGGNLHGFSAPGTAYSAVVKAGIGTARVILPDKIQKTVGKLIPEAEFAPSTLSGSFSKKALAQILDSAQWADGVLLAGDFGRNSETAILLDSFINKYTGQVTIAQDGLDYFLDKNSPLVNRPSTSSVMNLGKLQKLAKNNRPTTPVMHSMMLADLVQLLHDWTTGNPWAIITKQAGNFIAASGGQVSTTPAPQESNWQVELAAHASVWWLQQPSKTFEALSTAIYDYIKN